MGLMQVSLDDRYRFEERRFYLNGTQSLVRLAMLERQRRMIQGKSTAVYISGYRGSPLGGFDQALVSARKHLGQHIVFQPGVNEDLAATAVWGTQQLGVFGDGRYDGVSALWYGKGPGVDRTGDVFKHGNLAGSAREGGVLVVAGDDHTCKSSTTAHQSEFGLIDAMIPVLAPASVVEQIEYGLIGWELSRHTGLWVGMKVVTEIMDSNASVEGDPILDLVTPSEAEFPPGGLSLRWPDTPLAQEERLHRFKIPAALAFARANALDRIVVDAPRASLGIVTVGKTFADTKQALHALGIDNARAAAMGVRLYKVAMPWPLEPTSIRAFADGLSEIVVVEEKRSLVEGQLQQALYGRANAPRVVGKRDDTGEWLFPSSGDLGADLIAVKLGRRLARHFGLPDLAAKAEQIASALAQAKAAVKLAERPPFFCSGCPHNRSTKPPEGSKAFAGIGCHYLVLPMQRDTEGFTHMGGEGANWIGLAPFSTTPHMFQNLGDGTYFHSGSLAIRAAVAAKVNITYKILFNGAVAMTGGQPMDGELTPTIIARQMIAEGVRKVEIVTDDPSRYGPAERFAGVGIHDRGELDAVQRDLRQVEGVSVIIYDQACATELRRMRKRGVVADPNVSVFINDLVCEGCGDCSKKSNCLSVTPLDTEFGRKRAIDQSTCNKDRSCLDGFCPSFVTATGKTARRRKAGIDLNIPLPEPTLPALDAVYPMLVTGIGGTGVVTIGALIGMAAHMEGKAVRVMDMTGLAQKGGSVVSHIQLAPAGVEILASQVQIGMAKLLIGCDTVVSAAPENLSRVSADGGHIVASDHETTTGQFIRDARFALPMRDLRRQLEKAVAPGRFDHLDAIDLAARLVGDAVGANLLLLGFAWQKGLVPLDRSAIEAAIELNAVAVELNKSAFTWGRRAALDLAAVQQAAERSSGSPNPSEVLSPSLDAAIERRASFLADYQNAGYARRYQTLVERARAAEAAVAPGSDMLAQAVAHTLFKLMAYKDEYEVARLHTAEGFLGRLRSQFEGPVRLTFHMAPPLLPTRPRDNGEPGKVALGGWVIPLLHLLSRLRGLRGTPFDIFGYTSERRRERQLVVDYERLLQDTVLPALSPDNLAAAVALAQAPAEIRGYGPVKARSIDAFEAGHDARVEAFVSG